jgi:hypothetical protein
LGFAFSYDPTGRATPGQGSPTFRSANYTSQITISIRITKAGFIVNIDFFDFFRYDGVIASGARSSSSGFCIHSLARHRRINDAAQSKIPLLKKIAGFFVENLKAVRFNNEVDFLLVYLWEPIKL